MDWLQDKNNRPLVITIGAALIIIIIAAIMFFGSKKSNTSNESRIQNLRNSARMAGGSGMGGPGMGGSAMGGPGMGGPGMGGPGMGGPGMGAPGMGAPGMGGPGMGGPGMGGQQSEVVSSTTVTQPSTPMEKWRNDPFLPLGSTYKSGVKRKKVFVAQRIPDFPFMQVFSAPTKQDAATQYEVLQPSRRMSGILMNSRIYAIIETEGRTEIVQPGDMLKDRLARVERIDRDQVVLKTTGPRPRRIVVRFSGSPKTGNQSGGMMPRGMPGGMGPGGMRGGMPAGMQGRGRMPGGPM